MDSILSFLVSKISAKFDIYLYDVRYGWLNVKMECVIFLTAVQAECTVRLKLLYDLLSTYRNKFTTRNVWQSLAYSPFGAVVSSPSEY